MFNFFKKGEEIFAPMSGECVSIERVPDETFSKRMVGDGVAIIPSEGRVVAPLNCTVIQLFETKHAYILKAECGFEILIHVGIDTVNLKGEGFESYVSVSQKLSKGDMIANVDLDRISINEHSIYTPIIFMNAEKFKFEFKYGPVVSGRTPISYFKN